MAKPKTLGEVIGLRLPLEHDATLRERAATAGLSAADFARDIILGVLRGESVSAHPTARPRPVQETMPLEACPHIDYSRLSFGWKCKDCGAVSRDFGMHWVAVPSGGGG